MPPSIQTYHCICSALLLASTHNLALLPRRSPSSSLDHALILPLPSFPPSPSSSPSHLPSPSSSSPPETTTTATTTAKATALSAAGYTELLGLRASKTAMVVRKEDGFERRAGLLCERCGVLVGYEIVVDHQDQEQDQNLDGDMDMDGDVDGVYKGRILYVLPGGVRMTEGMVAGRKIAEGDVEIHARTAAVLSSEA